MRTCKTCGNPNIKPQFTTKSDFYCSIGCKRADKALFSLFIGLITGILSIGAILTSLQPYRSSFLIVALVLVIISIGQFYSSWLGFTEKIILYKDDKNKFIAKIQNNPRMIRNTNPQRSLKKYLPNSNIKNNTSSERDSIFVPELGVSLKYCCYQTYRLYEQYCVCGRAIPILHVEKST